VETESVVDIRLHLQEKVEFSVYHIGESLCYRTLHLMEVLMENYIGLDIAKSTLQIYIPLNKMDIELENSPDGLKKLYSKLKKYYKKDIEQIVFVYESTGSYSTILESFCQKQNIKCFKVGAYQSSSFAKTIKNRNKTDKVDAQMLSRMYILAEPNDIKVPYRDIKAHQIRSLMKYYQSLVKEENRLSNYLESATYNLEDDYVLHKVQLKIKNLKKEQNTLIDKILQIINDDKSLKNSYDNIVSIDGVGEKSGIILLYLFLRYPNASRQHITALSGLDPIKKESGTSVNYKAKISKQGLSLIRGILFMPTMSAIIYNDEMKYFYDKLLSRGKCKSLAQIAVMRKIILLAHSLHKNNEQYNPEKYLEYIEKEEVKNMA